MVAPVKREGIRVTRFKRSVDPSFCDVLSQLSEIKDGIEFEFANEDIPKLTEAAFLLPADQLPETVLYACFLDELLPTAEPLTDTRPLVVNPTLDVRTDGSLPSNVPSADLISNCFVHETPIAWVTDPTTGMLAPYWLRGPLLDVCSSLRPGGPVPDHLDRRLAAVLLAAGIVTLEKPDAAAVADRKSRLEGYANDIAKKGYAVVSAMLPPLHAAALRRYYRALVDEGLLRLGDVMVERRFVMPEEGVAKYWHGQMNDLIQSLVREPTKPSYSYLSSYEPGAALYKHKDREQCEFSVTMLMDYLPEDIDVSPWPLFLQVRGSASEYTGIHLRVGDGLVYMGRELTHYRDALQENHRSTSVFFHYVRADFTGSLT